jgi:hypothetical protein
LAAIATGNAAVRKGDHAAALEHWSAAQDLAQKGSSDFEAWCKERQVFSKLYSNVAAAKVLLGKAEVGRPRWIVVVTWLT